MAKFCSSCGNPVQEGTAFCSTCGARIENNAAPQYAAPVQEPVYNVQQPVYNVQQPVYNVQQPVNTIQQPGAELGMKWFKFIIYFQIFASAILNVITTFGSYNEIKKLDAARGMMDAMDAFIDGSQTWTLIVLVAFIALAVYGFMVRGKLAGFKVDGPKNYLIYMGLIVAAQVVYLIAVYMLIGDLKDAMSQMYGSAAAAAYDELTGEMLGSTIPSLVVSVVMIFVNKVYFDKRKHLFVNN